MQRSIHSETHWLDRRERPRPAIDRLPVMLHCSPPKGTSVASCVKAALNWRAEGHGLSISFGEGLQKVVLGHQFTSQPRELELRTLARAHSVVTWFSPNSIEITSTCLCDAAKGMGFGSGRRTFGMQSAPVSAFTTAAQSLTHDLLDLISK